MARTLHLYRSNDAARLVDALAEVLQSPLADPFEPERVVVQSLGMQAWLQQGLSARLGVCAHVGFPFPGRMIFELFTAVLGERAEGVERWTRERLTWAVLAELPALTWRAEFEAVDRYLQDDPGGRKRFQIAQRVARVFERYLSYRPEMVREWERSASAGQDAAWQPILWRRVAARMDAPHVPALAEEWRDALPAAADRLPERLAIFGVSSFAPLHLDVIAALAQHIDVHLFLPSPSRRYWADVRSHRDVLRRRGEAIDLDELHIEEGNPLLARFGRVGRDFQALLERACDYDEPLGELFREPAGDSLLHRIQEDVLDLRHRGRDPDARALPVDPDDRSLELHACHSPMRQVEVLQDRLLALFEADPALTPRDVLVMTPDLETYAPLIEAVFERDLGDDRFIPYRIADRSLRGESPVAQALLRALDLVGSRVTATDVLDLLATNPVRRHFGLETGDLDLIGEWVEDSGIRWALDAEHRSVHAQPSYEENTWRFGLDRLLVGHAFIGNDASDWQGVVPHDEVEGSMGRVLGRFADFCEVVFDTVRLLAQPRPLAGWRNAISDLLSALVAAGDDDAWMHQQIRDVLSDAVIQADEAGFDAPLSVEVVRGWLADHLQSTRSSYGFMAGGVTFCAMLPMRSIPFRVVALLGMDEHEFPRSPGRLGFDLVAEHPKLGDRSTRYDDRYLFLEAVLSARDRLVVTYTGQSVRDNRRIPPSVVVDDLLDAVAEGIEWPNSDEPAVAVRERLVALHPLQPFSPRSFDPTSAWQSFARAYLDGARALSERTAEDPPVFFGSLLPPIDPAERVTNVDRVVDFYTHPVRHLLRNRLGIRLTALADRPVDREPVTLGPLERWKLAQPILEAETIEEAEAIACAYDVARARGVLPLGTPGRMEHGRVSDEATLVAELADRLRAGRTAETVAVEAHVDDTRVQGTVSNVYGDCLVASRFGRYRSKDLFAEWVRLMAANYATDGAVKSAFWVGLAKSRRAAEAYEITIPDDPEATLFRLIRIYWKGMCEPLFFFPETAHAYADAVRQRKNSNQTWWDQRNTWQGKKKGRRGEREDPYYSRLFAWGDQAFEDDFQLGDLPSEKWLRFHALVKGLLVPMLDRTKLWTEDSR